VIGGTISANFVIQAMTFATSVLTARLLGPIGRGELALVLLYPQLVAGVAFLGVDRAIAILGGRGDLRSPLASITKLALLFSAPAIVAGYIAVIWRVTDPHLAELSIMYLAYVPATYFFTLAVNLFNGTGDFYRFSAARLWFYGCNLFLVLTIWLVASERFLDWIVVANLVTAYSAFFVALRLIRRRFPRSGRAGSLNRGEARAVVSLSLVFALPVMLYNVSNSAYQVLLEHWMGVEPLGLFVVYFAYSRLLAPLGSAIGFHVFHIGITGKSVDMSRMHRQSLLIYLVCSVPLWLLADWLIPFVFGRGFVGNTGATALLFASCIFAFSADSMAEFLRGRQQVRADINGRLIYLAVLGTLGSALILPLGLFGLALAMAGGDVLRSVYLVNCVGRETSQEKGEFWRVSRRDVVELFNRGKGMLQGLLARR